MTTKEETKINTEAAEEAKDEAQDVQDTSPPVENEEDIKLMEEMIQAGVCFGHKKSKSNPRMAPYVYTTRNEIQIIDVSKTISQLRSAIEFLRSVVKKEGVILIVGTTPSAKELVRNMATELKMPYVTERWLGGTLTNFNTIKKRIA